MFLNSVQTDLSSSRHKHFFGSVSILATPVLFLFQLVDSGAFVLDFAHGQHGYGRGYAGEEGVVHPRTDSDAGDHGKSDVNDADEVLKAGEEGAGDALLDRVEGLGGQLEEQGKHAVVDGQRRPDAGVQCS